MTGSCHGIDQGLPARINAGPLQHRFDRLHPLALKCLRQPLKAPEYEAGMGPSLQPHLHQIPCPQEQTLRVAIGETAALPPRLQPYVQPGGGRDRSGGVHSGGKVDFAAPQSCKGLTEFLGWICRAVLRLPSEPDRVPSRGKTAEHVRDHSQAIRSATTPDFPVSASAAPRNPKTHSGSRDLDCPIPCFLQRLLPYFAPVLSGTDFRCIDLPLPVA